MVTDDDASNRVTVRILITITMKTFWHKPYPQRWLRCCHFVFRSQSWRDAMKLIIIMKAPSHKVKIVSLMMMMQQATELLVGIF